MTTTQLTPHLIDADFEEAAAQSVRAIEHMAVKSVRAVSGTEETRAIAFAILFLVASLLLFAAFVPTLDSLFGRASRLPMPAAASEARDEAPCDAPIVKVEPVGMCLAQ